MPREGESKIHEKLMAQLGQLADERVRKRFVQRHRQLWNVALVEKLADEVVKQVRSDTHHALRLAQAAVSISARLKDRNAEAHALRAQGNALFALGQHTASLDYYQKALERFDALGKDIEVGRTLSSCLQPLIFLGKYDDAFDLANRAREIFARHNDSLRLARLDINVGNIFYRQDRFEDALTHYQSAYGYLRASTDVEAVAAVLSNIAVCFISLNNFPRALESYQQARTHCERHQMLLLVAQADYNIAYLYYLRGEYTQALELLQSARERLEALGDRYHTALCDLDQSEMYLELNLSEEAAQLGYQAFEAFEELGMDYEGAKALAYIATAASRQGKAFRALELFTQARKRFLQQHNQVWSALMDLYKALVLHAEGRYFEARHLCEAAYKFFSGSTLVSKAALCQLLLARLYMQLGDLGTAQRQCQAALNQLSHIDAPVLSYQAQFILGQIHEAGGDNDAAVRAFQQAHVGLEVIRSHLRGEELKIAFLKDKLAVYESLVWMCLKHVGSPQAREEAFTYIEQAKSRSLADLISFRAHALPAWQTPRSSLVEQVRNLREELNWYYRKIDLEEIRQEQSAAGHIEHLRADVRAHEKQLLETLRELGPTDPEYSALQSAGTIPLEAIRTVVPPDAILLEYYQARGEIFVCLLGQNHLDIVHLTPGSRVRNLLRLLQFQLSKFHLGTEYVETFAEPLREATEAHLQELYVELIAPVRQQLRARHLIIVPHDFLHYLPFHALHDGSRFLSDDFTISYAPSASVYFLCNAKRTNPQNQALILGVLDPLTPSILEEVQAVADTLPTPQLFLGAEASEERLRQYGPVSRFVHIATHGLFRQDNPMFSSIRLGNSQLSLFDLYHLRLSAELVTLSGCGTGLNVVVGGDELLGLVRGLLYAGAEAVLVTLWDVNDKSTAEFMKAFYQQLRVSSNKALALQEAMRQLRQKYPHPYYWAPFVLIGKFLPS